jgi:hypothetical protein
MPTQIPAADLPSLLVLSRHAPGFYILDEAGKMASAKGDPVACQKAFSFADVWSESWTYDAHCACYGLFDTDGSQVVEYPRLTKAGLTATVPGIAAESFSACVALDLDLSGHGTWDEAKRTAIKQKMALAGEALPWLLQPTVWYTTSGGMRLVYALTDPIPLAGPGGLEDLIAGLIGAAAGHGLVIDPACRDWTRLFRLPKVIRKDKPPIHANTAEQGYFNISFGEVGWDRVDDAPDAYTCYHVSELPCASHLTAEEVARDPVGQSLIKLWGPIFGVPPSDQSHRAVALGQNQPSAQRVGEVRQGAGVQWMLGHLKRRATKAKGVSKSEQAIHAALEDPLTIYLDRNPANGLHDGLRALAGRLAVWGSQQERVVTIDDVYVIMIPAVLAANAARTSESGKTRSESEILLEWWNLCAHCWSLQQGAIEEERAQDALRTAEEERASKEIEQFRASAADSLVEAMSLWLPDLPVVEVRNNIGRYLITTHGEDSRVLTMDAQGAIAYSHPVKDHASLCALCRDCGHGLIHEQRPPNRDGIQLLKTKAELVHEYGTPIHGTKLSRLVPCNQLRLDEGKVFTYERVPGMRQDVPAIYHEHVDQWLRAIGGNDTAKLLDWLATFRQIELPTAALILHGEPGIGKGMLQDALANLTESRKWAPFEQAMEEFQDAYEMTPLIVADEKTEQGSRFSGKSMINTFKRLVTGEFREINIKHRRHIQIEGHWRVVVSGNNADYLIQFKEDINERDLAAFAIRTLYIDCDSKAAQGVLDQVGGRVGTDKWPEMHIPQHILWLERNHQAQRGQRLLVEGTVTSWHDRLRVNSQGTNTVVLTLGAILASGEREAMQGGARGLQNARANLAKRGVYIMSANQGGRGKGRKAPHRIVVCPGPFRESMVRMHKDDRSMTIPAPRTILQSLQFLSVGEDTKSIKVTLPGGDVHVVRGMHIDPIQLCLTLHSNMAHCDFGHVFGEDMWADVRPDADEANRSAG